MRGVGGPLLTIGDLLSDLAVEGGDGPLVGVGDASAPSSPAASQQAEKDDPSDLSRLFEVRARFPSTHVLSIRHLLASSLLGSSQLPADAGGFLFLCVSVSFELGLTRSWEFLLLLALASSGLQVVGEMQSSLDRVRRQLSSTSTRHLLQGPLLKRSDTVNPLPSFPLLSGFQFGSCSLSRRAGNS